MTDEHTEILQHLRRLDEKMGRLQDDIGSLRLRMCSLEQLLAQMNSAAVHHRQREERLLAQIEQQQLEKYKAQMDEEMRQLEELLEKRREE